LITAEDDRRGCTAGPAVISHGFWQTYFGGADAAIGQSIRIVDQTFTVVGVTPESFTGPEIGSTFDVALPVCAEELLGPTVDQRDRWWLSLIARLRPGWTLAQAGAHLESISAGVFNATVPTGYSAELLEGYRKLQLTVIPAGRGVSRLRDAYGTSLTLLLALTALLLLITCGNLATLLLARASAREHELTIRAALGASRGRLLSQMLIESVLLAAAGALLAVPVAVAAARGLVTFLDTSLNPVKLSLTADWRLLLFIGATAVVTVIVFGCVPALRFSDVETGVVMNRASRRLTVDRRRARFQRGLVASQVALSLVLVVAALMFVQTFRKLAAVDVGFEQQGTAAVIFADPESRDLPSEQKLVFQQQLAEAIRRAPGVTAAASSTVIPLSGDLWSHFFQVSGQGNEEQKAARFTYVSPKYFDTLGIPLRAGRAFAESDDAQSRPVMIVNESFARLHLPGREPLGAKIRRLQELPGFPETTYEIVGVVGNTKYRDLRDEDCLCESGEAPMPPIAYVPFDQNPNPYAWAPVLVRSKGWSSDRLVHREPGQAAEPRYRGHSARFENIDRATAVRGANDRLAGRCVRCLGDTAGHDRSARFDCVSRGQPDRRDRDSPVARLDAFSDRYTRAARFALDDRTRSCRRTAVGDHQHANGWCLAVWAVAGGRPDGGPRSGGSCVSSGTGRRNPRLARSAPRSERGATSRVNPDAP
jgi:predicted permease